MGVSATGAAAAASAAGRAAAVATGTGAGGGGCRSSAFKELCRTASDSTYSAKCSTPKSTSSKMVPTRPSSRSSLSPILGPLEAAPALFVVVIFAVAAVAEVLPTRCGTGVGAALPEASLSKNEGRGDEEESTMGEVAATRRRPAAFCGGRVPVNKAGSLGTEVSRAQTKTPCEERVGL